MGIATFAGIFAANNRQKYCGQINFLNALRRGNKHTGVLWLSAFLSFKTQKMKTYIFYITSRESKKTRQIQLQSKSLESAEKEVKDKLFHHEDITGFAYF